MINFQKQNYRIYANQVPKPTFKGYTETTTMQTAGQNIDSMCTHQTYFFRNIETLNFKTDYITKNFKNGTNIADFASSTGEEAYSLAMLLKKNNSDKKYRIRGYDIVPNIIENMDTRLYEIKSNTTESFLDNDYYLRTKEQYDLRVLLNDCFEKLPRESQCFEYTPRNIYKLQKKLEATTNETEKTKLKYMLSFSEIPTQYKWSSYFYPKKDMFKDIVSFEVKDISDLGEKYNLDKNTGVVFFKNAFYHLNGMGNEKEKDLKLASKVTKEINKSLDDNGILVIGALEWDHKYKNSCSRTIKQDGKTIKVVDNAPFHQMLKENGFDPIFYEQVRDGEGDKIINGVFLPSVWKKVKNM